MSQAGKGHVPEENLTEYRVLARIARQFDTLGSTLSGIKAYHKANAAWSESAYFWERANALRVDLPAK